MMFKWDDSFSVKVPLIDEQHKRLFEIGNEINELIKEGDETDYFDKIVELIDDLRNYTKYHFEQEEKLMTKYNYDEIDGHIEEHNQFIRQLDQINFDEIDKNQVQELNKLMRFISTWILKHILSEDFRYSDLLSKSLDF